MNEVKVDKAALTERVQTNRDKHRDLYEKAIEGYRETVIAWFNKNIDRAKAGKAFETYFRLDKPEDHTADYDRVLDMLSMSLDGEITLQAHEFDQYVRDNWGWSGKFSQTSSAYIKS